MLSPIQGKVNQRHPKQYLGLKVHSYTEKLNLRLLAFIQFHDRICANSHTLCWFSPPLTAALKKVFPTIIWKSRADIHPFMTRIPYLCEERAI